MKIHTLTIRPYAIPLKNSQLRSGVLINIIDEKGNQGWGDIAPLPKWSKESLEETLEQLNSRQRHITEIEWTMSSCLMELAKLELLPALTFGLESALLSILDPLPAHAIQTSALLMGTVQEIMEQADVRSNEGYTAAKLKVSNLRFDEAATIIHQLKDKFRLRIDVNRAWNTIESLDFFAQFPIDTFDYVEEPFQNPHDLTKFTHPLAVDESFPDNLTLADLELLPTLKALIYKPTIQGGLVGCQPLHEWTTKRGISLVLSSSFESDLGLAHIASMAYRLALPAPVGIGTYHYLTDFLCATPLQFSHSFLHIPCKTTAN